MSIEPIPKRDPDSHKGTYGRVLLIGGSRGMAGSISLSAMAALRGGAGLVTVATAESCLVTVAGFDPCYMTIGLSEDEAGRISASAIERILELAKTATCIGIGPGMGTSEQQIDLVSKLYEQIEQPMVVDADALNCLAKRGIETLPPVGPRVLTPHPGEFSRLTGREVSSLEERKAAADEFANSTKTTVVLKGSKTVVSDGQDLYRNKTGNPGMATGGSGDVLTGLITALICQGLTPYTAACTGVFLHGKAGDFAAEIYGEISMTARDIVAALPAAIKSESSESRRIGFPT